MESFGLLGESLGDLAPRMDIAETDKDFQISMDLPGIEQKDLEVEVNRDVLTTAPSSAPCGYPPRSTPARLKRRSRTGS